MALADERFDGRIVELGRRRETGRGDRVGYGDHAAPPRKRRPVPQAFTRGLARLADRAKQGEARHPLGRNDGKVLRQNILKQTVLIQRDEDGGVVEAALQDLVDARPQA